MTSDRTYNVLFICTGNSARSIIAEALMNALGKARFAAWSAGSRPRGDVHPLALQTLEAYRIPADGLRSKSWEEFARPGALQMNFVFTVCDQAAGEACPIWPGQPITAHWGMPDPAATEGSDEVRARAFRDTFISMKRRIELFLALPLARIDAMTLQNEIRNIGNR